MKLRWKGKICFQRRFVPPDFVSYVALLGSAARTSPSGPCYLRMADGRAVWEYSSSPSPPPPLDPCETAVTIYERLRTGGAPHERRCHKQIGPSCSR